MGCTWVFVLHRRTGGRAEPCGVTRLWHRGAAQVRFLEASADPLLLQLCPSCLRPAVSWELLSRCGQRALALTLKNPRWGLWPFSGLSCLRGMCGPIVAVSHSAPQGLELGPTVQPDDLEGQGRCLAFRSAGFSVRDWAGRKVATEGWPRSTGGSIPATLLTPGGFRRGLLDQPVFWDF